MPWHRAMWVMSMTVLVTACQSPAPIVVMPPPTAGPTATPAPMRVYVSGAVVNPGVYLLPPRSIGDDALEAAGGAAADADLERVNLAHELSDQEHFVVPHKGEPAATGREGARPLVNINTATLQELEQLPGIGPAMAQRIVEFRQLNGPFRQIEDLLQVKGVGQATFDQLKDVVTVGD